MAGGLAALLDDVAALARLAAASADDVAAASAKAGSKALGVVIDDAAVTPQYVQGIKPNRELPIIWRITKGSLRNKLVIILPILLLLSVFAPWLLTPILMLGGLYLSFEGAEKIWELVRGKPKAAPASSQGAGAEDKVVSGAVRTDLILSAEIMVISMNSVDTDSLWTRAAVLIVIAIGITALVYGAVGLLVKMDDIGLAMASDEDASEGKKRFGRGLVGAMPRVMDVISYVGMVAMLWVGGHILLVGTHELGLAQPYGLVHHLEEMVAGVGGVGAVLAWLVNTFFSFVFGLVIGAVVAVIVHFLPFGHHGEDAGAGESTDAADGSASGAAEPPTTR
jgi:predicted DNA repair protein MutK